MNSSTRVVLITGWGLQLNKLQLAEEGIEGVITKPFRREELEATIAQTLEAGKMKDERRK